MNSSTSTKGVEVVCHEQKDGDQHQRQKHGGERQDNEGELDDPNKESGDIEGPEEHKGRYGNEQSHPEQSVPVGFGVHHQDGGPPDAFLHVMFININKTVLQSILINYGTGTERWILKFPIYFFSYCLTDHGLI